MFLPEINWLEHLSTKEWYSTVPKSKRHTVSQAAAERRTIEDYIKCEEDRIADLVETMTSIHEQVQQHRYNIIRKLVLLSPIRRVPSEIIAHIFSFQILYSDDLWRDRYSALSVCRHWYNVAISHPSLWSELIFRVSEGEQYRWNAILQQVLQRTNKHPLHFVYSSPFLGTLPNTSAWEICVRLYLPRVYSLEIETSEETTYSPDAVQVFRTLQSAPKLHTLSLSGFECSALYLKEIDGSPLKPIILESVHTLNIHGASFLTFLEFPNLNRLHIDGATISGNTMAYFANKSPLLRDLTLRRSWYQQSTGAYAIPIFPSLTRLEMSPSMGSGFDLLDAATFPKLKELEVRVTPDTWQYLPWRSRPQIIVNLTTLRLVLDDCGFTEGFASSDINGIAAVIRGWLKHTKNLKTFKARSHSDQLQSSDLACFAALAHEVINTQGDLSEGSGVTEMEKADWELFTELCPLKSDI